MNSGDGDAPFDRPSLDLLKRTVARAEVNPLFAQAFVEAAARMANTSSALRTALNAQLTSRPGRRVEWTMHDKKLVVDLYDRFRMRLSSDVAYETLSEYWPQHKASYWRKKVSEFRRDIIDADPLYFGYTKDKSAD